MEKFADQIETLLIKKQNAYGELVELLKKERQSIVDIDIASLWEASTRKKQIGKSIETLRSNILFQFDQQGVDHSMVNTSFSLVKLMSLFSVSNREKARLLALKFAIDSEKAEVGRIAMENQKHVRERLGIIENLVATLIPMPASERYGWRGSVMLPDQANCFINKEV